MSNDNFSIFEEFKKAEEEKRKRRKKIFFSLFLFLIIIFVFSFKFFNDYFRLKPETILSNALYNMFSLNSFRGKGNFSLSLESLEKQNLYLTKIETKFLYDRRDKEKIKTSIETSLFLKKANFEIEYFLAGQLLKYENSLYFIFSQISPSLELFFRIFSVDISKWKNEWIKINTATDFLKNFIDFSEKRNLFRAKTKLPDTFYEGKKVYHLLVVLNKEEIFNFLSQFLNDEKLSFKDFSEKIGDLECEFFIDKKNFMIYKIILKKNLEISKKDFPESWQISFLGDIQFFDFEERNEIFQPTIFKEFQTFYKEFSKIFQSPLFNSLK